MMKRQPKYGETLVLIVGMCILFVSVVVGEDWGRRVIPFNDSWLFARYGANSENSEPPGIELPEFDDSQWKKLTVPHDWGIEGPFRIDLPSSTGKLPWAGIGWYRKHFVLPITEKGKRFFILFDGAMSHAKVWLNGHYVGEWPYGYASFTFEITPYLHFNKVNVLAVRLENPPNSSRWYPGAGIYRNVWLIKTHPVHFQQWGITVTTPKISDDEACVLVRMELQNQSEYDANVHVSMNIYEQTFRKCVAQCDVGEIALPPGKQDTVYGVVRIKNPKLWSTEFPNMYTAVTYLVSKNILLDSVSTSFGIRTARFTADSGFLLNGKRLRIQGVCNHHDLGILGTAVYRSALLRQLKLLREVGCNAIRTSHNPPAPDLLELCDSLGFLVIGEAFDCWVQGKTPNDYSTLFLEWHERDIRAFVRRDRNHPCIIAWSAGNEVREQGDGIWMNQLRKIFLEEDSTRPITAGCDKPEAGFNGFQMAVDVFGYNYKPHLYKKFHEENPTIPLYGSETASCVSSYGEYFFPVSGDRINSVRNNHVSSYDLYTPWWATIPDVEFEAQDKNQFVAGEFVWTGFDYLGEPAPFFDELSVSRSSYFGIFDLCGFKKDRFYLYQSRWRPDYPMAHILPHWNWPDRVGKITPVFVYTTGDEAELFLNGTTLGRQKKGLYQYRFRWDSVRYEPGELKVVTYKNGREWAVSIQKTTEEPYRIQLTVDTLGSTNELLFITTTIVDRNGYIVPTANNLIEFKVNGPGKILAVGNGDPTDHRSFQSSCYNAFHGQCLLVVRPLRKGTIIIRAISNGLQDGYLRWNYR